MTILYKKDTSWKIRFLSITSAWADVVQVSWVLNTISPITAVRTCKGKNIGRSNETTPQVQAEKEVESLIKDKLTKWYFLTQEEVEQEEVILPMLAKDFNKEKEKIDWSNCYTQPKLDWMRALVKIKNWVVTIWSRQGKEITTCPHIIDWFTNWAEEFKIEDKILDWELYAHWFTFQENMEMVKKYREGRTDKFVKFHMYDRVWNVPFKWRFLLDMDLVWLPSICKVVCTTWVNSIDKLKTLHSKNIEDWYEGTIVRWGNEGYKPNWRSSNLLKYKDFLDLTATIIDVEPSDARPTQWVMVCENENWERFKASLKFSFEERERILREKNSYIWRTAEIRFFEYTDGGLPRFPVCVGFRLDK